MYLLGWLESQVRLLAQLLRCLELFVSRLLQLHIRLEDCRLSWLVVRPHGWRYSFERPLILIS